MSLPQRPHSRFGTPVASLKALADGVGVDVGRRGPAAGATQPGFERFTRHGPVRDLNEAQRLAVLSTLLPAAAGQLAGLSPLKSFALGLNAERTLVEGRTVRIGNATQTLHPVAGRGLNLGLRCSGRRGVLALQRAGARVQLRLGFPVSMVDPGCQGQDRQLRQCKWPEDRKWRAEARRCRLCQTPCQRQHA